MSTAEPTGGAAHTGTHTGTHTGRIVVGVDGSAANTAALRYAAAEAERLGTDLLLVHAEPNYLPIAGFYPGPLPFDTTDVAATGGAVLAEALRAVKEWLDPSRISTYLATGDPVFAMLGAAEHARLVVLGAGGAPVLRRLAVGSVVANVAARAEVPVVAVPADWTPAPEPGRVVVGVKRIDAVPRDLLDAALELAGGLGSALAIVHVWDYPEAYHDLWARAVRSPQWASTVEERLREQVAPALAAHPEVEVEVAVRHGQAAAVLQEESASARLLVVARRAHAFPAGHFGSTGRTLLREARCPVEVLPMAEAGEPGEDGAATGRASSLTAADR